jgi:fructosamine-3-kinase
MSKKLKIKHKDTDEGTTEAEKKVNADLGKLDQSKAVIVPFLITISEKDHSYIIEKWLSSSLSPDMQRELELLGNRKSQLAHLLNSF